MMNKMRKSKRQQIVKVTRDDSGISRTLPEVVHRDHIVRGSGQTCLQTLKNIYPDKFRDGKQDVEFYTVYILNGEKLYKS